jgi:NitT/TauT family transport system substrate-binding protein
MTKKHIHILFILLIFATSLSACSTVETAVEKQPLRIGWSLYPGWYPLVLAQQQGLFEKHGVEVELVLYPTYDDTAPQLASGFVDAAALVLGDVLLEDVGTYASVVLVTDNSFGADQLIASPEVLKTQDLRGKRIGFSTGTFGELLVREMLKKYDVEVSEVSFIEISPEQVPAAIPSSIDIGHTYEPFASQARVNGNDIIFTSADAPGVIVDTVAFRNSILKERPEDVRNFIDAWFEAVQYWQANPEEGNKIIAEATGQEVKDISFDGVKFFDRNANLATFQAGTDTSSIVFTAQMELQFLIETGVVTKPLNINNILNASYLQ